MAYQIKSKEEQEFLNNYRPGDYENPAVTTDMYLFGYRPSEEKMYTLLIQRGGHPCRGYWAFPGGFIEIDESLEDAVARELMEETAIEGISCVQMYAWGEVGRDPRQRVITVGHVALVNMDDVKPIAGDDAAKAGWFSIDRISCDKREYQNQEGHPVVELKKQVVLTKDELKFAPVILETYEYGKYLTSKSEIVDDSNIAFDHARAAVDAIWFLRDQIEKTDITYNVFHKLASPEQKQEILDSIKIVEQSN